MAGTAMIPDGLLLAAIQPWLPPAGYSLVAGLLLILAGSVLYFLCRLVAPKVAAIAMATGKESMAQPLFAVCVFLGITALLIFPYIPYNTFGEDIKVVKDSGLTLIKVLSIVLGLWSASLSISEEIDGRTALTLLSKPVTRRQFILGKFLGILGPVFILFVMLGVVFLTTVSYKLVYEAREGSLPAPTIAECQAEIVQVAPGIVLQFLETVVLVAISVAISTRLSMLANLVICAVIYALGHLVPVLVESGAGRFEIVAFVGKLIAVVLPVLDHFDIQASVATGSTVPLAYLGWATLYCAIYTTAALVVALIMFEDRDLA